MFRDDIKRTIGTVLKANGHKMTELGSGCIYYMKRFSPELAYYIRCSDYRSGQGDISFDLFFTVVDVPCDVFLTFGVGLHVKILSIYEGVTDDFMCTNELMTNAGEQIIVIENKIGSLAPVILDELEKPYYMNRKIPHYRLEREIYRQVEGDEYVRPEFDTLKKEMCRIIKRGGKISWPICGIVAFKRKYCWKNSQRSVGTKNTKRWCTAVWVMGSGMP